MGILSSQRTARVCEIFFVDNHFLKTRGDVFFLMAAGQNGNVGFKHEGDEKYPTCSTSQDLVDATSYALLAFDDEH